MRPLLSRIGAGDQAENPAGLAPMPHDVGATTRHLTDFLQQMRDRRVPLRGTIGDIAVALGTNAGEPADLYSEHAEFGADDELAMDPVAAELLLDWFARGDRALRRFAQSEEPILWPEHFDLGIAVGEVNYGVSPGDGAHPLPYAYVGPWTPRHGDFWNAPFGAVRTAEQLPDADAVAAFFAAGRDAAG